MIIEPKAMIVCGRFDERIPGFIGKKAVCADCIEELFLCDTTIEAAIENGFTEKDLLIQCMECVRKRSLIELPISVPISKKQIEEIKRVNGY